MPSLSSSSSSSAATSSTKSRDAASIAPSSRVAGRPSGNRRLLTRFVSPPRRLSPSPRTRSSTHSERVPAAPAARSAAPAANAHSCASVSPAEGPRPSANPWTAYTNAFAQLHRSPPPPRHSAAREAPRDRPPPRRCECTLETDSRSVRPRTSRQRAKRREFPSKIGVIVRGGERRGRVRFADSARTRSAAHPRANSPPPPPIPVLNPISKRRQPRPAAARVVPDRLASHRRGDGGR